MKYHIECRWEMAGGVEVEADTLEQAIQKVNDGDTNPDGEYVKRSFEVIEELSHEVPSKAPKGDKNGNNNNKCGR